MNNKLPSNLPLYKYPQVIYKYFNGSIIKNNENEIKSSLRQRPKPHQQYEIFIPNNCKYGNFEPFDILLIVQGCNHSIYKRANFTYTKSQFPLLYIHCDLDTNWKSIRDGGIILDFIVDQYDKPLAKKYIFIHDHDISWHYKTDIWDRLNYIVTTHYFDEREYGGIYCKYWFTGYDRSEIYPINNAQTIDDAVKELKIIKSSTDDYVERKDIFPCCNTFFVNPKLFYKYKSVTYTKLHKRLRKLVINTFNEYGSIKDQHVWSSNWYGGIWLEAFWHDLFGYKIVPLPPKCEEEIKVYGNYYLLTNETE